MTAQMMSGVTSTATGASIFPLRRGLNYRVSQGVVQVTLSGGTATVVLEGRGDPNASTWTTLATWTADDSISVQLMNELRLRVTAYTSGTINGYLNI
jgi:hypothetical protein